MNEHEQAEKQSVPEAASPSELPAAAPRAEPAERVTRPVLDRSHPVRGWSTLFAAPSPEVGRGAPGSAPGAAAGAAPRPGPAPAETPGGAAGAGGEIAGAMAQAIDIAFRAASEYTQQSQRAARRLGGGSYGLDAAASDVQHLTARFGQYASEMAQVWFQLMQAAMTGRPMGAPGATGPASPFAWLQDIGSSWGAGAAARPRAEGSTSAAPAPPVATANGDGAASPVAPRVPQPISVSFALATPRPIEIALDLREEARGRSLVVHALRPLAPGAAPIPGGRVLVGPDGRVRVELAVPPDQAPGEYGAAVVDEATNVRAGSIRVVVGPAA
jgi:hypothetical protein